MANKKLNKEYQEVLKELERYLDISSKEDAWDLILTLPSKVHHDNRSDLINTIESKLSGWKNDDRFLYSSNSLPTDVFKLVRYLKYYRKSSVTFKDINSFQHFKHLTRIDFQSCESVSFGKLFFDSDNLKKLEYLKIHNSGFSIDDMEYLCKSNLVTRLSTLHIGKNSGFISHHLKLLGQRTKQSNIKHLIIKHINPVKDDLISFFKSKSFPSLKSLDLSHNFLIDKDLDFRIDSSLLKGLKEVDLSYTKISQRGANQLRLISENSGLRVLINDGMEV